MAAFLVGWGGTGSADGQFRFAIDLAVDPLGFVYVTDFMNYRVQKFTSAGAFVTKWGSSGNGDGQFGGISSIAAGRDGRLYVADAANGRIQVFTANGQFEHAFGAPGTGQGQMDFPNSPAVDDDYVYVADVGNHRMVVFRRNGEFVTAWGSLGSFPGHFHRPTCVSLGPDREVFVADKDNHRIQKFTSVTTATRGATWGSVKATYRLRCDGEPRRSRLPPRASSPGGVHRRSGGESLPCDPSREMPSVERW